MRRQYKKPIRIARDELYARVWETPMSRLATQYGITGNGLAKICRRLDIPYPPRGYWAKKAAGKPVSTTPLPKPGKSTPTTVTVEPTLTKTRDSELPSEVQERATAARESTAALSVPERLTRPHPVIAEWLAEKKRRKEDARRGFRPWAVKEPNFTALERREHRILDTLFKALEAQDIKVRETERRTLQAEAEGEKLEFRLREKQKQIRIPLTEREKRYSYNADRGWHQELQGSGKLVFAIRRYLPPGMRHEWLETDTKPMEQLLPDIVATFVAVIPILAAERREREAAERERQRRERERYKARQRQVRDDKRWQEFVELARRARDIQIARTFLERLKQRDNALDEPIDGRPLRDWLSWAEARIQDEDPSRLSPEALFEAVASVAPESTADE